MNLIDQERNFRTQYYEKVGFRAVDEKKSVETLLKDTPIKKDKLQQFCLLFGIPAVYRNYVWKLLLGMLYYKVSIIVFCVFILMFMLLHANIVMSLYTSYSCCYHYLHT